MGAAASVPSAAGALADMSYDDLAALADANKQTQLAEIVRENEISGDIAEDLDDEMLAEISQQLEECSIDECHTIATSVHYVEIYSTFCRAFRSLKPCILHIYLQDSIL